MSQGFSCSTRVRGIVGIERPGTHRAVVLADLVGRKATQEDSQETNSFRSASACSGFARRLLE
jgi:hypothetical protein